MIELDQIYTPEEPIHDTIYHLSDPRLSHETHRDDVNGLILNLVIKFVQEYLGVQENNIQAIRVQIRRLVESGVLSHIQDGVLRMIGGLAGVNFESPEEGDDLYGLKCLVDIHSTATIVKEIIFNRRFEKAFLGQFISADFGSGTGILTLASAISAMRQEANEILAIGIDLSQNSVVNSQRTLTSIGDKLRYRRNVDFRMLRADITRQDVMRLFEGLPLGFWTSETIGSTTPNMRIADDTIVEVLSSSRRATAADMAMASQTDPFPIIFANTVALRPGFIADVREGRTAMFPDIVRGLFVPNRDDSTLMLETGNTDEHLPLHRVGEEFAGVEELDANRRWKESTEEELRGLAALFGIPPELLSKDRDLSQFENPKEEMLKAFEAMGMPRELVLGRLGYGADIPPMSPGDLMRMFGMGSLGRKPLKKREKNKRKKIRKEQKRSRRGKRK